MAREDKNVAIFEVFEFDAPFDPATPERNLLRAMIMLAMSDLKKTGSVRRQALEYFLNPDDDYVLSFQSVCAHLNIDPNSILIAAGLKRKSSTQESDARH